MKEKDQRKLPNSKSVSIMKVYWGRILQFDMLKCSQIRAAH